MMCVSVLYFVRKDTTSIIQRVLLLDLYSEVARCLRLFNGTTWRLIAQNPKHSIDPMRTSDLIIQYTRNLLTLTIWLQKPVYVRQQ
jgi:hypothetical protein